MTEAERRKHIEEEATFKATVISSLEFAKESRERETKAINDRIERGEKHHTTIYGKLFDELKADRIIMTANQVNIENVLKDIKDDVKPSIATLETDAKKSALKLGGGAGGLGAGIIIAIKELWSYVQAQLGGN